MRKPFFDLKNNTELMINRFMVKHKMSKMFFLMYRMTKKTFQDEELPHELFLTTRQKTKIRNAFH